MMKAVHKQSPARRTLVAPAGKSRSSLEEELHLRKERVQRFVRVNDHVVRVTEIGHVGRAVARAVCVDVAEAAPWFQGRSAERKLYVVDQERTILDAHAQVKTDVVADVILEEQVFERLRAMKAQVVRIQDHLDALGQV